MNFLTRLCGPGALVLAIVACGSSTTASSQPCVTISTPTAAQVACTVDSDCTLVLAAQTVCSSDGCRCASTPVNVTSAPSFQIALPAVNAGVVACGCGAGPVSCQKGVCAENASAAYDAGP